MTTINQKNEISLMLDRAYKGSYYTIVGAGGPIEEWQEGYSELLAKEGIGVVSEWIMFKGRDMNEKYHLTGEDRYKDDLTFLAFPIDGLRIGKLTQFRIKMEDRWFNDIVDNLPKPEKETQAQNITPEIREQILLVRKTGATNMFNVSQVRRIAEELELDALDDFLQDSANHTKYFYFIMTGDDNL